MDRPDAYRWHDVPDTPVLIALTDDERLHPLDVFADEPAQAERPQVEKSQTFERVPAYVGRIAPLEVRRASPLQPETRSPQVWQARRWAVVLTAIVVVYTATTLLLMRTTAGGPIATLPDRTAEPSEAARPMPETVAFAAVPAPTAVVAIASSTADEPKARERVATRESRRKPPVRPEPPIRRVAVSSPRTVEPLPIRDSPNVPLPASPPLPASLPVERRPVVESVATLPRSEASPAPVPRMPPPEAAIQTVLGRYRTAYQDLDVGAARAIWPSVDSKALGKAFDRLEQQDLFFDSCQIAVSDLRAVASCEGFARYVPRVGSKAPRHDQRQWEFRLSKVDDAWQIETVSAR